MSAEGKLTKQVSVFLENKSGRLADVCRTLGEHGINIRALCIADTSDFGILRLIVNRPDDATTILRDAGFSVGETNVIAVQIPDVPGGLGMALALLEGAGVNVEYMYAFFTRIEGNAVVLFRVADDSTDKTVEVLEAAGCSTVSAEDVYAL
jgi:hypothetical protein